MAGRLAILLFVFVLAACGGGSAGPVLSPGSSIPNPGPTSSSTFSATPLIDMGSATYFGFSGGLYGGGSNTVPAFDVPRGIAQANAIVPLDTSGNASASGKYVLLSIGMSNATDEWCGVSVGTCNAGTFTAQALSDPSVNQTTLVIANGAQGGQTASAWASPNAPTYDFVKNTVLPALHVTEAQVEAVWLKDADANPTVSLPSANADAFVLESNFGQVLRALKVRYPNLHQVFMSSRIYAGYATTTLNPEPFAYESGFSVRGVILAQITQMQTGVVDSIAGNLDWNISAPWVSWAAYLWANGAHPRSDGLVWLPQDFQSDGTHPSASGVQKVGALLLSFFKNSQFTKCWFVAGAAHC